MNCWDLAYGAMAPGFFTAAAWKRWRHGKYRRALPGMFGANLPSPPLAAGVPRAWLHSVSVGETVAAGSVFRLLRERHPDWEFLSTTTTETGQDQARKSLAGATHHDFAPVDFSWKVAKFFDAYNPSLYLFFETEIWPNLLAECGRRALPTVLVNGKLSERSARRWGLVSRLFRSALNPVSAFLLQTAEDAERFAALLGSDRAIHVTGNVKFDSLPAPLTEEERAVLRESWGFAPSDMVIVAGSTHPGEEELLLDAWQKLRPSHEGLRLVIAPRHPERFDAVERLIAETCGAPRRTSQPGAVRSEVVLLDEMGVLARSFGAADIAIVGGGWNRSVGGHNLLEPAAHGVPVVHGPNMRSQKEIMRIVRGHDAAMALDEDGLSAGLARLLDDTGLRRELGARGLHAAIANAGAAHRSVELIEEILARGGATAP